VFAVAPDPGVIDAQDDAFKFLLLDGLLEDGVEQLARLPGRAGEDFVIGRPILLGIALKTDGASQSAFADPAQDAKSQSDGAIEAALLREDRAPGLGRLQQIVEQVHGLVSSSRKRVWRGRTHTILVGECRVRHRSWRVRPVVWPRGSQPAAL